MAVITPTGSWAGATTTRAAVSTLLERLHPGEVAYERGNLNNRVGVPMVLLAGDTPVDNPRHLQGIDQRELVKTSGAGFEQIAPRLSLALLVPIA